MSVVPSPRWSLVDIGLNLTDKMFRGTYNGHHHHADDMEAMLSRAKRCGVRGMLITGGSAKESEKAIELCQRLNAEGDPLGRFYCTVGCHPTRCSEFLANPDDYYNRLDELITKHSMRNAVGNADTHIGGCVAAIGEIGLDYDRLFFCPKDVQLQYFERQLCLAEKHQLPLFLHDRSTAGDCFRLLSGRKDRLGAGVVHSFTGSAEELQRYLELGLYIGINGCSLKTEENLAVARSVPLDRLLIETDAPWCEVKSTHASRALLDAAAAGRGATDGCVSDQLLAQFPVVKKEKFKAAARVKGRCEPCNLVQVLEALYELRRDEVSSMEELADIITTNTKKLFPAF